MPNQKLVKIFGMLIIGLFIPMLVGNANIYPPLKNLNIYKYFYYAIKPI